MITIKHTHQGWVVGGGGLPPQACWEIFETEGEARDYAYQLAEDLYLEVQS